MSDIVISLRDIDEERALFGHLDRNLRLLRMAYDVQAVSRGGRLTLSGDPDQLESAAAVVEKVLGLLREEGISSDEVGDIIRDGIDGDETGNGSRGGSAFPYLAHPKSPNQKRYMDAILENDVTFGVGPAGSGKTYLAVAMALGLIKRGDFRRIILVRPAVEAGEHLGFLPGDLEAKVNPYLRPLNDALEDLLPTGVLKRYLSDRVVEMSPLAYMRGRTLNHSVIILDEAQNTTPSQMKMLLTRMGTDSKVIVTGDVTQVDLPNGSESGLVHALRILRRVEGLAACYLHHVDIVRHPVVQGICRAYGSWEEKKRQDRAEQRRNDGATTRDDTPRGKKGRKDRS